MEANIEFIVGKDTYIAQVKPRNREYIVYLEGEPFPFCVLGSKVYRGGKLIKHGSQRLLALTAALAFRESA